MNAVAIILAYGQGRHLSVLSHKRASSAVPFAGKYRIIDFVLSNCVNSDIRSIGILTQYRPRSLNDHIGTGRPWDLDRIFSGGITLLPPYQRKGGAPRWYRGAADAVFQNLDFVLDQNAETVLVLSGDQVYKMDFNPLLRYHHEHQADATICAIDVKRARSSQFRIPAYDDDERILAFQEAPLGWSSMLVTMGVYVFRTDVLLQRLAEDAQRPDSTHDFCSDVLSRMFQLGDRILTYPFGGCWKDVGTVPTYWEANMDLLEPDPPLNLLDPEWPIRTRDEERPPTNILPCATVSNSLVTDGCVIEGHVEGSVLSPGVRVRPGAVVRNSIILSNCDVGSSAVLDRAVLDKNVLVGTDVHIGMGVSSVPASHIRSVGLRSGISLVGKNTCLPAGLQVGCDCVIGSDLVEGDLPAGLVSDGQCIGFQPSDTDVEPTHGARRQQDCIRGVRIRRADKPGKTVPIAWLGSATNRA
jgi:glucose-1-phosphate adenylyltransferase